MIIRISLSCVIYMYTHIYFKLIDELDLISYVYIPLENLNFPCN